MIAFIGGWGRGLGGRVVLCKGVYGVAVFWGCCGERLGPAGQEIVGVDKPGFGLEMVTVEGEFGGVGAMGRDVFNGVWGGEVAAALGERGLVEVVRGFDLGCQFLVGIWRVLGRVGKYRCGSGVGSFG